MKFLTEIQENSAKKQLKRIVVVLYKANLRKFVKYSQEKTKNGATFLAIVIMSNE